MKTCQGNASHLKQILRNVRNERGLTLLEGSAADEGVAGHVPGARTDGGGAVFDAAVSVDSAHSRAGIHALGVDAGRSAAGAVTVAQTLRTTRRVRVPEVTLQHYNTYGVNYQFTSNFKHCRSPLVYVHNSSGWMFN